jgi:hypothetical protein
VDGKRGKKMKIGRELETVGWRDLVVLCTATAFGKDIKVYGPHFTPTALSNTTMFKTI